MRRECPTLFSSALGPDAADNVRSGAGHCISFRNTALPLPARSTEVISPGIMPAIFILLAFQSTLIRFCFDTSKISCRKVAAVRPIFAFPLNGWSAGSICRFSKFLVQLRNALLVSWRKIVIRFSTTAAVLR